MDTRIYVMTHKKIEQIPDELYIPLQVGKAGKEDFGYMGDDLGDHISEKNARYCELTGMYWLWKNVRCDVIGVCHYRRFFVKEEKLLSRDYIEHKVRKYPIIVPNSSCVKDADAYEHYAKRHYAKDLDLCREILLKKSPEYTAAFDFAMETILVSVGNMWITRKDIFDRYCEWLFAILFEVEKGIDFSGYDDYQQRVMGFLSERLFRVWLFMQPEAVWEENMKLIDPSAFSNAEKRIDLIYRYVKLKIDPVLRLYKSDAPRKTLAAPFCCQDDFHGKIPVWVCWWQGESEMPELIRRCVSSLKRNLPAEKTELKLITLENCMRYVTFTDTVIRKFNEGKITYTHLSDLLRAELLYRYGGMWVDATYYVARPIQPDIFAFPVYTLRFQKPIWEADITKGRWSGNLWHTASGKKLFSFLMESLWYYWEVEEKLIDYFLADYVIAVAKEAFADVKNELEQCVCTEKSVFDLHRLMNCKYTPERMEQLQKNQTFYKLNRHAGYRKANIAGEETIYGHIVSLHHCKE